MHWRHVASLAVIAAVAAGCATTPSSAGRAALREGRAADAASNFEAALAQDPERLDALIGLGIARFRLGNYDEAITALSQAVNRAPAHPAARLYLALAQLRKHDDAAAIEHLTALRSVDLEPRFAALVDQALALLREGPPSDAVRTYMIASLDYGADWSRELAETRRALRSTQLYADPLWHWPPHYYVIRPR
jgi:tetratricopeptide (TPR) repeat protein